MLGFRLRLEADNLLLQFDRSELPDNRAKYQR